MNFIFDIGGTNLRFCIIAKDRKKIDIDSVVKIPTPKDPRDFLLIVDNYIKNSGSKFITKTIGGSTGVIDQKGNILNSLHLPMWRNFPLRDELSKITKSKVLLKNDATLATLGEAVYGEGRNYNIVSYITISTGVGGSRVINKKIDTSSLNFEIGHSLIQINNSPVELETLISGSGFQKRYGRYLHELDNSSLQREVEFYSAIGIVNLILHWSPEIVIIGGGVGKSLDINNIKIQVKKYLKVYPKIPLIIKSDLRHNVLHGAFYLLNS